MLKIPPSAKCDNCGERPATIVWIGEGSMTDILHGGGALWCEVCAIKAQLEHIKKQIARVPKLESRLKELTKRRPE
jgi:hypothetical protein